MFQAGALPVGGAILKAVNFGFAEPVEAVPALVELFDMHGAEILPLAKVARVAGGRECSFFGALRPGAAVGHC